VGFFEEKSAVWTFPVLLNPRALDRVPVDRGGGGMVAAAGGWAAEFWPFRQRLGGPILAGLFSQPAAFLWGVVGCLRLMAG